MKTLAELNLTSKNNLLFLHHAHLWYNHFPEECYCFDDLLDRFTILVSIASSTVLTSNAFSEWVTNGNRAYRVLSDPFTSNKAAFHFRSSRSKSLFLKEIRCNLKPKTIVFTSDQQFIVDLKNILTPFASDELTISSLATPTQSKTPLNLYLFFEKDHFSLFIADLIALSSSSSSSSSSLAIFLDMDEEHTSKSLSRSSYSQRSQAILREIYLTLKIKLNDFFGI
ncbi:MAG: hypothetical protein HQK50_09865 [Oligoflexia bacterium]|nr:hypothetical protein [Oligoflexia bacterium]MBF0365867.1 hypothetical protein [Oligoflexia bacterium]